MFRSDFPQTEQFCLLWDLLLWYFNWISEAKFFPHGWHKCGLSPSWNPFSWSFHCLLCLNTLSHNLHWYDFFSLHLWENLSKLKLKSDAYSKNHGTIWPWDLYTYKIRNDKRNKSGIILFGYKKINDHRPGPSWVVDLEHILFTMKPCI